MKTSSIIAPISIPKYSYNIIYFSSNFTRTIRNGCFGPFVAASMFEPPSRGPSFGIALTHSRPLIEISQAALFSWGDRFFRTAGRFRLISFLGKPFPPLKRRTTLSYTRARMKNDAGRNYIIFLMRAVVIYLSHFR